MLHDLQQWYAIRVWQAYCAGDSGGVPASTLARNALLCEFVLNEAAVF